MSEKTYQDPELALNRIYTRRGDSGETSLVGGQRLPKDDLRIECFGTVDELNSFIGMACVTAGRDERTGLLASILLRVQHELFNLGSILATLPADVGPKQPQVTGADVSQLESEIDEMNADLPSLRSFVLPGGTELNAQLHVARTVCRRAERLAVTLERKESIPDAAIQYLNRLSDALFVWSRWANVRLGITEVLWEPNKAASGLGHIKSTTEQ
ncbi:MAG: cob(I)yrinic acid a,c-diamide adenosyltransferase [Bryobacteraceae bacterium]|nr:cob(I)yrinic acid a,c-diamide adenosyltransferase [Bryobacteraceae bacterium]